MGKDEHKKAKNSFLAQTPKKQLKTDGMDVEYAEEFADHEDKEAQARDRAANKRASKK